MQRTTTPDEFSRFIKSAYRQLREGRMTRAAFAEVVQIVWDVRVLDGKVR